MLCIRAGLPNGISAEKDLGLVLCYGLVLLCVKETWSSWSTVRRGLKMIKGPERLFCGESGRARPVQPAEEKAQGGM